MVIECPRPGGNHNLERRNPAVQPYQLHAVAETVSSGPVTTLIQGETYVTVAMGVYQLGDLIGVISAWGACPAEQPCLGDLNIDGVVNVLNLLLVITNWD